VRVLDAAARSARDGSHPVNLSTGLGRSIASLHIVADGERRAVGESG
jgi:hypothetical protein